MPGKEIELPDFHDLIKIADEIADVKKHLVLNKAILDDKLAAITEDVYNNEIYWIKDNKAPSMAYIATTYHIKGRNEDEHKELMLLRIQIGNDEAFIKQKEMVYNVYRDMIDVWRTHQADKRGAYLSL